LDYCRFHKLWRLHISDALETDLFYNKSLNRRLKLKDAMEVLESMIGEGQLGDQENSTVVVYWRKPEEWANAIYDWVSGMGMEEELLLMCRRSIALVKRTPS
jgi:ESCRT-II complex subunit VPS25